MALNPYTDMQAQALTAASNNNLATNVMPGINSGAQAAGQYGGTRQGIAQGVAAGQAQTGLNSAIANLYAGNYATDQSTNLAQQSINNQATANNQSFYSQQRGLDQSGYQLGSNLYNAGVQGNVGLGVGMYNTGQTYQNAPLTALQQYSSTVSPYTGYGQSSTTTGPSSTAANVLGGATIGNTLGNSLSSLWGNSGSSVLQNSSPYATTGTNYNALSYTP